MKWIGRWRKCVGRHQRAVPGLGIVPDSGAPLEGEEMDRKLWRVYEPYRKVTDEEGDDRIRERLLRLRRDSVPSPVPATFSYPSEATTRGRRLRWTRRPLMALVAALLVSTAIVGAGYAASTAISLVDRALSSTPASRQIVEHDLGQAVNFPRQHCGFTLTISRIFADPHLVVISYTVRGPDGRTFFGGVGPPNGSPLLTDERGRELLPAEGQFAPGSSANQTADFWAFQTSASPTGPVRPWRRPLLLHLTVPGIQLTERYDQPAPRGRPCEKYSRVGRAGGHRWRDVTAGGPFAFALTVPVTNDLRVAFLRQTARMGRVRMTLERVELTPSDARVYWRDNLGRTGVGLSAELGGPPILQPFPGIPPVRRHGEVFVRGLYMGAHHGLRVYTFDVPGYDFHGQWTLLIYNDAGTSRGLRPASARCLSLHFKVP